MPISANALIAGRYRLLEQLGAGAMGEVWKALDERFDVPRTVAIKLLKEDESLREDQRVRDSLSRILQKEELTASRPSSWSGRSRRRCIAAPTARRSGAACCARSRPRGR